jgi:putative protease
MEVQVGKITHFYNHINVAVLDLTGELKVGDIIHILGHITDFEQRVASLEIEHKKVQSVSAGMDVALQVEEPVRNGDCVFRVVEDK